MTRAWHKEILPIAALIALCGALFLPALGTMGLMDPDEPFYSLTGKEMLERHDASVPVMFGKPQFEKPILFYWVLYGLFGWLGVSEFSARLGPCLAGVLTVLLTYAWGRALFKRRDAAFLSALVLAVSAEFVILSRIVLTDMFLCLFVTATFLFFTLGWKNEKERTFWWHAMFASAALGFLTKGPLGFLIPFIGISSYFYLAERPLLKRIPWVSGLALFSAIGLPWYVLTEMKYPGFLAHFFVHENVRRFFVAEHSNSDKWFFYPLVFLGGFFPWTAFIAAGVARSFGQAFKARSASQKNLLFLALSLSLPLFFFTAAKSKLMSYFFPLYPVIALMAGAWMARAWRVSRLGGAPGRTLSVSLALFWGLVPAGLVAGVAVYALGHSAAALLPMILIAVTFVPLSWTALLFYFRKKYHAMMLAQAMAIIFVFGLGFGALLPQLEDVFSSKEWAQDYFDSVGRNASPILLSSKLYARGMSYYTGNGNVGVLSEKADGGFYTPHPIRIVSTSDQLSELDDEQFPLYFVLRKKEMKHLRGMLGSRYTLSILEDGSQRSLSRLDRV